ncbi:cellulose binding domain-containing protein [Streptomyces sp. MS06]|uniref:cellulose binding domain-containing protein n=1 Tax=Streptomyces sp. MS06 TaxID=3385974 RepID=UPI0039A1E024
MSTPLPVLGRIRTRLRGLTAVGAVALLALGAGLLRPSASEAAGQGCDVSYTAYPSTGAFTAQIHVTNLGPAAGSWQLTWTYTGDEQVTAAWNATVTQSGRDVTATNAAWNGDLPTGGSVDFGLQGTGTAAAPPAHFALNGASCNDPGQPDPSASPSPSGTPGGSPSPSPSPTNPTASPSPSEPTGSPTPTGCGTAVVCSGFEDQSGPEPSGSWQVVTPDCQGSGRAVIDTSVAHTGTRSLRIDGHAGYCNHVFAATTRDVSGIRPVLYARLWMRHTTALPASHVAAITLADAADGGKDLRLGGQNGALQWNRQSDDATLPVQSPAGVAQSRPLPTGQWVCLRFRIDTTQQSSDTYLGDTEVPGLHLDGVPTQDVDSQWLSRTTPPRPTTLRLGWESYGGGDDTLWFDDVAVGPDPIGC